MTAFRTPHTSLATNALFLCMFLCLFFFVAPLDPLPGSTPGLMKIFKGRCLEFFVKKYEYAPTVKKGSEQVFCEETWGIFANAFAHKDICTVKPEAYQAFFDKTGKTPIKDKLLFWSGTKDLSNEYADHGKRAVTLADTLTGYLVTDLNWCGSPDEAAAKTDGIDFVKCKRCKTSPEDKKNREGFEVFWGLASEEFAERAVGLVRYLVTGTAPCSRPACHEFTFFYKHELPKLDASKVSKILVIVANQPGKPINKINGEFEKCGSGSLKVLGKKIDAKKIPHECEENPADIMDLMCADVPKEPACKMRKMDEPSADLSPPFKKSKFRRRPAGY